MCTYMYVVQWNLSNLDTLGTEESVLISTVRCPDFRDCNVHKQSVQETEVCPVVF